MREMMPAFLDQTLWGQSVGRWIVALTLVVLVPLGLALVRRRVARKWGALAERTQTRVDDAFVGLITATRTWFFVMLGIIAASLVLDVGDLVERRLRTVAVATALLQIGIWGSLAVRLAVRAHFVASDDDPARATGGTVLRLTATVVVWSVVVLMVLANLGVDVTALVAGLGIGGVAVALALQNILSDLFASISILLDRPFVVGDFIIVGDELGTVEKIGIKTTRVRSLSGEQLIFANNDLLTSRVRNYKRMQERRVVFRIGVLYETPADKLEAIPAMLRQVVEGTESTRFDRAHFAAFGDFSLVFEVVYHVLSSDFGVYMDIQQRINLAIYRRFEHEGIGFAYPTQTLHVPGLVAPSRPQAARGRAETQDA
jgi:small-conductance mechanosensitive channel